MKNRNIRLLVRTAVLLALLVVLQAATKAAGQLVTGSCVNAVLAVAAWMSWPLQKASCIVASSAMWLRTRNSIWL